MGYADMGLDAIVGAATSTATELDLPPWMMEQKEPTQGDVRDWFLGTAANSLLFGLVMGLFTHERRAGVLLMKASAWLAVPAVALAVIPMSSPTPKK